MMQRTGGFNSLSSNSGSLRAFNGDDLAEDVSPGLVILRLQVDLAKALYGELCLST